MSLTPRLVALAVSLGLAACAARTMNISSSGAGGVPPVPVGVNAPKWDHYCSFFGGGRGGRTEFAALLDDASANHWEMVSAVPAYATILVCFKRPAQTPPATAAPDVGRPSDIVLPPPAPATPPTP
jgi:hypothetical protein